MTQLSIGLMTGTSCDGVDAILADFSTHPKVLSSIYLPFTPEFRRKLLNLIEAKQFDPEVLYSTDGELATLYATAVNKLLTQVPDVLPKTIKAIGSHGQTIRHAPLSPIPFTTQIGDPNLLATQTGIPTVADFRRKDIAVGGQGAPFAPVFHQHAFQNPNEVRVILNIGGIANITRLDPNQPLIGFDSGPGNTLMDAWTELHWQKPFDESGERAHSGKMLPVLLENCLSDPYFDKPWPKSTGREYFNLTWLSRFLQDKKVRPEDVLRTLLELTAKSIADSIHRAASNAETIYLCGGGAYNPVLVERLKALTEKTILTTDALGVAPNQVESLTFAWLAYQTIQGKAVDLRSITGAKKPCILGGIYLP